MPAATKESPDSLGTGRRKTSVARVRIRAGSGKIMINDRPLEEFFNNEQHRFAVLSPLKKVNGAASLDVSIRVHGGGITGQAGACMLGIARALKLHDPEFEPLLRDGTYLTRDSRMKERKKYGLHGARRGTQFSKR